LSYIPKHDELEALSIQDLIDRYNSAANNTIVGTGFYREEITRRQNAAQTKKVLSLTKNMHHMTIAITLLTIVNVILVGYTLLK